MCSAFSGAFWGALIWVLPYLGGALEVQPALRGGDAGRLKPTTHITAVRTARASWYCSWYLY